MSDAKHTPGPWGASGTLVVTPPPADQLRMIKDRKLPFTSRRICVCEPSHYMGEAECEANARLIATSPAMYEFVRRKAQEGDQTAAAIIATIHS